MQSSTAMKRKQIVGLFLFFMVWSGVYAQNNISVSNQLPQYMDLNPDDYPAGSQKINFQYTEWINYTTLIDSYEEPAFSITVQLASAHKPKGLEVQIKADPYKGLSPGEVGTPTGINTVSKVARVLIDNISTSYTGSGTGQGHRTVLFFSVPNYIKADTGTYKLNVVFTLMQ